MKRILVTISIAAFLLGTSPVEAQTPFNPTTYSGWLSTPNNYFANLPAAPGILFSQPVRGAGNQFSTSSDGINAGQWQNASSSDAIAANRYFVFSIVANAGTGFQVDSLLLILGRSGTGPDSCILQYKSPATGYNFVPVTPNTYTILNPATDPTTSIAVIPSSSLVVSPSDSIVFRLVAWHASSSLGKMRIVNNTAIYGSSTAPSHTIDAPVLQITHALCVSPVKGDSVQVAFNSSGTFNNGNTYSLELSDASGSFSSPVTIGSLNSSSNNGLIHGFIPAGTLDASYRLRIKSSNPAVSGMDTTNLLVNPGIVLNALVLQPDCPGTSGSIDLAISGGSGTIQYNWSNGATTQDLSGLSGETVDVVVTDDLGCSADSSFQILTASTLAVSAIVTNASCASCNGTVTLIVSGGNPPYAYEWENNTTLSQITGIPGTYCVEVSDGSGCTVDSCLVISSTAGTGSIDQLAINVFPNPSSEVFYIHFPAGLSMKKELVVTDLSGKVVYQASLPDEIQQADIPVINWSNGTYTYRIILENEIPRTGRIVVSH